MHQEGWGRHGCERLQKLNCIFGKVASSLAPDHEPRTAQILAFRSRKPCDARILRRMRDPSGRATTGAAALIILKVGTLDDPSLFGAPQMAIYTVDKQPFHIVPEGLQTFERLPPR